MQNEIKKNSYYEILPFFLYKGVNDLLQNEHGITVINNKELSNMLLEWDKTLKKSVSYSELYSIFQNDTNDLISFLIEKKVLKIKQPLSIKIRNILIVSDDIRIKSNLYSYLVYKNEANIQKLITVDTRNILNMKLSPNDLVIVSLTKYNDKYAEALRELIISSNSFLLFGYYYAGNYYIDNFYKAEWYNPCHKCNFENIKAQLRINNTEEINYQEIIDDIYKADSEVIISAKLPNYQKDIISLELFLRLHDFIGDGNYSNIKPDSLSIVEKIDLTTNKISKDFSIHWELCDCYEK